MCAGRKRKFAVSQLTQGSRIVRVFDDGRADGPARAIRDVKLHAQLLCLIRRNPHHLIPVLRTPAILAAVKLRIPAGEDHKLDSAEAPGVKLPDFFPQIRLIHCRGRHPVTHARTGFHRDIFKKGCFLFHRGFLLPAADFAANARPAEAL